MTGTHEAGAVTTTVAPDPDVAALEADLLAGFWSDPPTLPPRWFYDEKGSLLFDEITRLPEYYPTRCEAEILRANAAAIVGRSTTLVELGAGTSTKTRVLLDVLSAVSRGTAGDSAGAADGAADGGTTEDAVFVPVDISAEVLLDSAQSLAKAYPGIRIDPVVGDFTALRDALPGTPGQRLVLFLGGTLGNFSESQRRDFYRMLRGVMAPGDRLVLGVDLVKNPQRLVMAYDDAAGVTAEFNRNMLDVIARTVECEGLRREDFRHESVWNVAESRIEMWLRAVRDVRVDFPTLGRARDFAVGEGIRTEIARKFSPDELLAEVEGGGFIGSGEWTDEAGDFGLSLVTVR